MSVEKMLQKAARAVAEAEGVAVAGYQEQERIIEALGYTLWELVARHSELGIRLSDRMNVPQPGDLVLEVSTVYMRPEGKSPVGWLMERVWEVPAPDHTEPEWIWRIRAFNGEVVTWRDAKFVALPITLVEHWKTNPNGPAFPVPILDIVPRMFGEKT